MRLFASCCFLLAALASYAQSSLRPEAGTNFFGPEVTAGRGSYLGVALGEIDADQAKSLKLTDARGVEVKRVEDGSPANKAGIRQGDVLLTYNGENVVGAEQMGRLVRETPEGRRVKIQVWRDGKALTLTIMTQARPPRGADGPMTVFAMPELPDLHGMYVPDIPSAILVWKSSALGVQFEPVNPQLAEYFGVKQGVLIRTVMPGSSGEKAGLKAGDVLVKLGDRAISGAHDVSGFLRAQGSQSKPIQVSIVRERKELRLTVTPDQSAFYDPMSRAPQAVPNQ